MHKPGYREAVNPFNQEWVEPRLKNRIAALLTGMLNEAVTLRVVVVNGLEGRGKGKASQDAPAADPRFEAADPPAADRSDRPEDTPAGLLDDEPAPGGGKARPRKLVLPRAYGSERARGVQPER